MEYSSVEMISRDKRKSRSPLIRSYSWAGMRLGVQLTGRLEKIHAVEESVEPSGRERRRLGKLMVVHSLQKCEMLIVGKETFVV